MRSRLCILAFAAILSGCSGGAPGASPSPAAAVKAPAASGTSVAAAHSYPLGSVKKGDMALCAICAVNEGATEKEAAVEVIDYEGKTYAFCNEQEKAQFISTPAKFAAK